MVAGSSSPPQTDDRHSCLSERGSVYFAHLPLPFGVQPSEEDRIPYCSDNGYDGGSFLEYPTRAGWPQALPHPDRPSFVGYENFHPSDDRELEKFLQTWLFFGLLNELLGSKYVETNYTAQDTHGPIVHTEILKNDLDAWSREAEGVTQDQGHTSYRHFQRCLLLADDALTVASPSIHPNFNRVVRQSIALLCDTITMVISSVLPQPDDCNLPDSWGVLYDDTHIASAMMRHNWCHGEAAIATRSASPSSVYFMERMKKPSLGRDHVTCGQDQCHYLTTDDKTYRPRHVDDKCDCEDTSISLESLAAALDRDAIPLLRLSFGENSSFEITVEASDTDTLYVALSHVWADGLGNKKGNSLPTCQLRQLVSLVEKICNRLPGEGNNHGKRELLFWCDTLCVPIEHPTDQEQNRVRNLAMQGMRDVYRQATYVLVLDRTFVSYNISDIGLTEAAFRIMTSPWVQRLWTYQEAVLPESLLFQFADTAVDLKDIMRYNYHQRQENILLRGIAHDIVTWCLEIRQPFHSETASALTLRSVISSLQGRRVSFAADEPLCLSTIFDAGRSLVHQAPPEERMIEFWRAIYSIPTGMPSAIVFSEFPRLRKTGLRWAPSTLLVDTAIKNAQWLLMAEGSAQKGQLKEGGLLVTYPAFRVKRVQHAVDAALLRVSAKLDANFLQLCDVDGTWYSLNLRAIHDDISPDQALESILSENAEPIVLVRGPLEVGNNRFRQTTGLLTTTATASVLSAGTTILRSLVTIMFTPMRHSNNQIVWAKAYEIATQLRDSGLVDEAQSHFRLQAQAQAQAQVQSSTDSQAIASEPVATQVDPGSAMLLVLTECVAALCKDNAVLTIIQGMGRASPTRFLATLVLRILLGRYLTISEKFDADHVWCVD